MLTAPRHTQLAVATELNDRPYAVGEMSEVTYEAAPTDFKFRMPHNPLSRTHAGMPRVLLKA